MGIELAVLTNCDILVPWGWEWVFNEVYRNCNKTLQFKKKKKIQGRVEGLARLRSWKHQNHNYLLDNSHWQKRLESTKKYILHQEIKKQPLWDSRRGTLAIKSNHIPVGDPQTGKEIYRRGSPTGVRVLSPTSGSPAWGSGSGRKSPQGICL